MTFDHVRLTEEGREILIGAAVLAALPLVHLVSLPNAGWCRPLVAVLVAVLLGLLAALRWDLALPFRAPAWRILLVAAGLTGATLIIPSTRGLQAPALPLGVLLFLSLVGSTGSELFLRGSLYSLLERWRGTVAAVVGSALPESLAALLSGGMVVPTLILGLLFGLSRSTTGSVAPALVARVTAAFVGYLVATNL